MHTRIPMIAGNWKMNLTLEASKDLVGTLSADMKDLEGVEVLVAPPFTALGVVREAIDGTGILLAAQNMHWEKSGAYTGEVSPAMLLEAGCSHVILGHSERRTLFQETDDMVNQKVKAAVDSNLIPIVCMGETLEQREAERTFDVIRHQLDRSLMAFKEEKTIPAATILAYEPVWAIGTGKTATPEQAQDVHAFIRNWLKETFDQESAGAIRILYGGSVKPDNVADLMSQPDLDGALVGGASLKADSFGKLLHFKDL